MRLRHALFFSRVRYVSERIEVVARYEVEK